MIYEACKNLMGPELLEGILVGILRGVIHALGEFVKTLRDQLPKAIRKVIVDLLKGVARTIKKLGAAFLDELNQALEKCSDMVTQFAVSIPTPQDIYDGISEFVQMLLTTQSLIGILVKNLMAAAEETSDVLEEVLDKLDDWCEDHEMAELSSSIAEVFTTDMK